MRILFTILTLVGVIFASSVTEQMWPRGETLITFLNKHQIPKDIYFNLSKTDKELCSEIEAGKPYQTIYDDNGQLLHLLIPISEEMQIHIYKKQDKYILEIVPIIYESFTTILTLDIQSSPYQDIIHITNNYKLAHEFVRAFKKSVNFKKLHKGDKIVIKYKQKLRLGKYFGSPEIIAAMVKMRHKRVKYIFQNPTDGRYYDQKGRSLTSVYFKIPLRYKRISSKFTYKRFHPILHRYIAHLGIDYAAPRGRKVYATADGKLIFRGRKGGYGNAIMIRHAGGYRSLYGHLSKFNKRVRLNSWIKQGTLIGYVGTTGRSTGPHLHFGLYKNGRAVNPAKVMSYSKKILTGKQRKTYLKYISKLKKELDDAVESTDEQFKIDKFDSIYSLNTNKTTKE